MLPTFTTLTSSARRWEQRFEEQQTVAEATKDKNCRRTMQRLADASRSEANRAWHLASQEWSRQNANEDPYLRALFWVLRKYSGLSLVTNEIQGWDEVCMLSCAFKKSKQEVAADFIAHARLLGE